MKLNSTTGVMGMLILLTTIVSSVVIIYCGILAMRYHGLL